MTQSIVPLADLTDALDLLRRCDLPTDDLPTAEALQLFGLIDGGRLLATVGLERCGEEFLMRSLAVDPDLRGDGLGLRLLRHAEATARDAGGAQLYLLTTTAERFFAAQGFRVIERDAAPTAIRASTQFGTLCPASAVVMHKPLAAIRVRQAQRSDVDILVEFAQAMAWETEHKRLDGDTVRRGIAAMFDEPGHGRYLVAVDGDRIVGGLMLTLEWSDWRCADWWWIQSVYVRPEARRHGVFRRLYAQVLAEANATPGVCGLRLYVERDNLRAQSTYAALGMVDAAYRVLEQPLAWVAGVIRKE